MEMDAGMCAAVGPSGAGGFERRSTHCVHNLVSVAAAARPAEEDFFHVEREIFRSCAGAKRRRRVFEARSRL